MILEIKIDIGAGERGESVQKIARGFKFSHGKKIVHIEEEPRGIEKAWPWRHAWQWREGELFIVVEDDAEMSPHWYRALVNMWKK